METKRFLLDGMMRRFSSFYLRHAPDDVKNPYSDNHWKEKVLYAFVLISIPVGIFVFSAGMPVSITKGDRTVAAAAALGLASCFVVFFNPRLRFEIRAIVACFVVYFLGISLIVDVGPFLGTREYFFAFSILASLLLGWTGAVVSIVFNLLTFGAISLLVYMGFWGNILILDAPLRDWHMIFVDLVFVNITTTVLITLFFKRIEQSDMEAKRYSQLLLKESETLAEANRKLESEMDIRQVMTLALQASEEKYRTILGND